MLLACICAFIIISGYLFFNDVELNKLMCMVVHYFSNQKFYIWIIEKPLKLTIIYKKKKTLNNFKNFKYLKFNLN